MTKRNRQKKGKPIHGWIIIDKPEDIGSTPIVGKVKRKLDAQKAGHGGTLDPFASGLLPIALGEATKTVPMVMDGLKEYIFEITFGESRDTDDLTGQITGQSENRPHLEQLKDVIRHMIGPLKQIPPIYSALKLDGQRAYDLARKGEEVILKSRHVHLYELVLLDHNLPHSAKFRALTSKGFYIRSLGRDIAKACQSLGYVSYLRRTKCGNFSEKDAISLEKFEELGYDAALSQILPLQTALDDILALAVSEEDAQKLAHGNPISAKNYDFTEKDELILLTYLDTPLAMVFPQDGQLKILRKFNITHQIEGE